MSNNQSWADPTGSGFHSAAEKDANRRLRDQVDALSQNYTGTNGWQAGEAYADSVYGGGKYEDDLMNDEYVQHIISYLGKNQKQADSAKPKPKPKIQLSETVAKAVGQAQAYEDIMRVRDGDYALGGSKKVIADFNKEAKANTEYALKPKIASELYSKKDREPREYANDYKLALADQLKPSKKKLDLKEMYTG